MTIFYAIHAEWEYQRLGIILLVSTNPTQMKQTQMF